MKTNIINILNTYAENKYSNDFNLVLTMNNYLSLDETIITKIDNLDDLIRITLINGYDSLIIIFYDNGDLGLTLPLSGLFRIIGNNTNIKYDEIKQLLNKELIL